MVAVADCAESVEFVVELLFVQVRLVSLFRPHTSGTPTLVFKSTVYSESVSVDFDEANSFFMVLERTVHLQMPLLQVGDAN